MAAVKKGSVYSSYGDDSRLYLDWQQTGQSIEKNETYIKYQGGIQNGNYWYTNAVKIKSAHINGIKVFDGKTYSNVTAQGKVEKFSGTATIKHGSDGTKKFTVKIAGWFYEDIDVSGEKTFELTPIPRVSDLTLDVDTVLADEKSQVIATTTKKADAFTDVLTVSLGDYSQEIESGKPFKIPKDWINAIPGTSAVATVKVETFSGETSIGTKTVDLTVNVPESVVPVINDLNISEAVTAVTKAFGNRYVQNLSQLNVSVDAEGVYGSTIKSYSVTLDGVNYGQEAFMSNVIKTAGTLDIKVKVTDSRGRTAESDLGDFTVDVIEYVKPTLEPIAYEHIDSDSDGEKDSTKVTIAGKVYPVEEQNTKALKLYYKSTADEFYTERVVDLSDWTFNVDVIIRGTDPTVTYEYIAELTDKINADSPERYSVTTGIAVISRKAGGTGVTFFGEAEEDGFVVKDKPAKLNDLTVIGIMNILADGGYINVAEFIAQLGIDSVNADYPGYTDGWRWVKYKNGTFKAEHKATIATGTSTESGVIEGLMAAVYEVALPFSPVEIDIPKWGVQRSVSSGIYWTDNRFTETPDAVAVNIYRAIATTGSYDITVGCTVTGLWNAGNAGIITQLTATHDGAGNVTVYGATATHDGAGNVTIG